MVGSCKCGSKVLRSMKCGEFSDQLRVTVSFPRKLQGIRWEDVSYVRADIQNYWKR